ncbi:hypothetical protein PG993_004535 [Apiospora rasikravindrae]|uniref:Uncharacterized protein n=1 Tax=Apiospora rasikravindrae TaxID=990691 RepID=A0ABR1TEU0_9PEZI
MSSTASGTADMMAVATARRCANCDGIYFKNDGSDVVLLEYSAKEIIVAILIESQVPHHIDLDSDYANAHDDEAITFISDTLRRYGLSCIPRTFLSPGPSLASKEFARPQIQHFAKRILGEVASSAHKLEVVLASLLRSVEEQRRAYDRRRQRAKSAGHEAEFYNEMEVLEHVGSDERPWYRLTTSRLNEQGWFRGYASLNAGTLASVVKDWFDASATNDQWVCASCQ